MTWLIIAIVLLAAFGPVLWLVPSKRDRRLATIREAARTEGLSVEIQHVPKTNPSAAERVSPGGVIREPTVECASYSQILRRKLRYLPPLRLLKAEGASDGPVLGWIYDPIPDRATQYLERAAEALDELFPGLPEDVLGVEISERAAMVFWLEGPGSGVEAVHEIAERLRALESRLLDLDARIEAEISNEDS